MNTAPTPSTTRPTAGRTSRRPTRWSRTTPTSKPPPPPTPRPWANSSRCSRRPTTITRRRTTRTTRWPRAKRCIRVSSRRGMPSRAPTRRCAATSKPSTTSARWRQLAAIERSEGRKARYHVEALMIQAKRVLRAQDTAKPDVAAITQALTDYEDTVKAPNNFRAPAATPRSARSSSATPSRILVTAKQLMRRIRDHVPYSQGDKMMLGNAGGGWMVEGSPPRLLRDYNQLVDAYNRGANI